MDLIHCYRCIRCFGSLNLQENESLACSVCKATYPSIKGVKVLATNPTRLLQLQADWLAERRKEIIRSKTGLLDEGVGGKHSPAATARAMESLEGRLANLDLLERVMAPARDHLAAQPRQRSLFDAFSLGGFGKSSFRMLGYFYRDWGGTEESRFLTDLLVGAVDRLGGDARASVAVLGCGAGRLVHELAELFPVVFGVDLSVDSLLLVDALLEGAGMDFHFSFPHPQLPVSQKSVKVKGPEQRRRGI